MPLPA
jgi:hypothetical protein